MKKALFLVAFILLCIFLTACSQDLPEQADQQQSENSVDMEEGFSMQETTEMNVPKEIPEISVTIGESFIPTIHAITKWNGIMVKRLALFDGGNTIPIESGILYSGQPIIIDFGEFPPSQVSVMEVSYHYGLSSGQWLTHKDSWNEITPNWVSESLYEISPVFYSNLSSVELQIGSKEINFYSVTVSWGENICEYGFFVECMNVNPLHR